MPMRLWRHHVEPLLILDTEQRIMSASTSFYEVFATTPQETVSRSSSK